MPKSIVRKTPSSIKEKYHQKVLSSNAIYINWIRMLDIQPLFARIVWLDLSIFDLSQLGLGLLYYLLPIDLKPFTIDFDFELPSIDETLQGIWMKFKPVNWEFKYDWLADFKKYIVKNFKEKYRKDLIEYMNLKAIYGKTQYARSYYDPFIPREMMRSTMIRLRLMRTPDTSWLSTMQTIQEVLEITGITDDHVFNRVMMHYSAQSEAFVLGMAVLGKSKLCKMDGDFAVIPFMDSQKNMYDLKFRTLDHIQLGFILGVTPIGYGLLLPKESIYQLPDGKKNPPIIDVLIEKMRRLTSRLSLTAWAYGNYNRPSEMSNYHESERTNQYDLLQAQRRQIEQWVYYSIPPEESNAVKIRQYQNAVLQAISWKAKRHKWGFKSWEYMTEEQFKEWWLNHWETQGLKRETLNNLYGGMSKWLERLREEKVNLGSRIQRIRKRLAMSV